MSRPLGWEWQEPPKPMTCRDAIGVLKEMYETRKRNPQKEALAVAIRTLETQIRQNDRERRNRMTPEGYEKCHQQYLRRKEKLNARTQENATSQSNTISV